MEHIVLIINNILPIIFLIGCIIYWVYYLYKEFKKEKDRKFKEILWGLSLSTITLVIYIFILIKKY